MDDFVDVMNKAFNPNDNGVKDWWDGAFNEESINQQNTILKGMFSTNKYDQEQGRQALLLPIDGGAAKIYDHPVGKPNNYDPVYNPDPRLPDAPRSNKPPTTTSSTSTYIYIGGALVLLFVLFKK